VTDLSESRRRWQAWFDAYGRISDGWPNQVDVECPDGDGGIVRIAFVAGRQVGRGQAYLWCDVGRDGIFLHRVGIPEGAPRFPVDADDDEIDKVIPPDIHFFPPEPAAES
jgi:hypothetical protein